MNFVETPIEGVLVIEPARREDDRGWFARTYCRETFAARGLNTDWPQCNASFNRRRGTLRGMHWQADPHGEIKLVRCPLGAAFDVTVDLRPESATYGTWFGVEISAANGRMVYMPLGIAHGFQTLADDTEIYYQMGTDYVPGAERGIRWDDPAVAIDWPLDRPILSPRDAVLPVLADLRAEAVSC